MPTPRTRRPYKGDRSEQVNFQCPSDLWAKVMKGRRAGMTKTDVYVEMFRLGVQARDARK